MHDQPPEVLNKLSPRATIPSAANFGVRYPKLAILFVVFMYLQVKASSLDLQIPDDASPPKTSLRSRH